MSDIQRWEPDHGGDMWPNGNGRYVLHADHVEALRQAEQRGFEGTPDIDDRLASVYREGQRDALAGAVQRYDTTGDEVIAAIKGESL
jgi:hypothetical protein